MARKQVDQVSAIFHKRRWSAAEAQLVIRASQESGMPLSGFAREHGLQRARLWRWSSRLRKRPGQPALFHPVRILEPRPANHSPAVIEVVLLDGRRVRLAEGFAAADLARVLAVLEGVESC
ncbi:MAG: transposase [Planctomycetes bacterium]|nr:transposase [Planctomycetota bacterium]